jgi:two-component system chemotaxis sensor kinase CheA
MECTTLVKSIDDLASDLLFLDGREIDIPSSGKFMNRLEEIIKAAEPLHIAPLTQIALGMNQLLEKIVFDTLKDREAGFGVFEKGVALMQEIVESCQQIDGYSGDVSPYLTTVVALTGIELSEDRGVSAVETPPEKEPAVEKTQILDVSLVKDFISEGLEYIEEIEVNILKLEQSPENMEYINTIFRPFHSMKGVASFLNLEKIRELAHNLESLLDKARNSEIRVTPGLIDVVLDGADALKVMILQLKDEIENQPVKPLDIDLVDLTKRIKAA